MMEEVSISVAYNAHVIDQMSEEEILASLVAESLPKQPVSPALYTNMVHGQCLSVSRVKLCYSEVLGTGNT